VNQFAVTLPDSSIPVWTSGAKALGAIAKISGDTTSGKYLVCVQAGTTAGSAPSIAGAIGDEVTDGSVKWQIASRVPFAVMAEPATIEGVPLPAGGYFDGAYIRNLNANFLTAGTINGDLVNVTKALKAADVTAGAIWTGDVTSTSNTVVGGVSKPSFSINASTGLATFNNVVVRGTVYATAGHLRGLNIEDSAGNVILSAGSTLQSQITQFVNAVAQAKADLAEVQANSYADGIVTVAEANAIAQAQAKADLAEVQAVAAAAVDATTKTNAVQTVAQSASDVAAQANAAVADRLKKSGTDVMSGEVQLASSYAMWFGTSGYARGPTGVYIGSSGIVGKKGGAVTFSLDNAGNAIFGGNVVGGQFTTGAFTGWGWPAVNNYGSYFGPSGLLLGNYRNNKFFQVTYDGNVSAPGFSITNGNAVFSGNVSASTLSAQSMDVALRNVLETGSITVNFLQHAGNYWEEGQGQVNYPAGTLLTAPINRLIATNIYDAYLLNSWRQQPFKANAYFSGTGSSTGGSHLYNMSITTEIIVSQRFSIEGLNTENNTRLYILIKDALLTSDTVFANFTFPSTINWILSRA